MRPGAIVLTTLFGNQPEQPKLGLVDATACTNEAPEIPAVCHATAPWQFAVSCGGHFHGRAQTQIASLLRVPPKQESDCPFFPPIVHTTAGRRHLAFGDGHEGDGPWWSAGFFHYKHVAQASESMETGR